MARSIIKHKRCYPGILRHFCLLLGLLSLFVVTISHADAAGNDILAPEERLWLDTNLPRIVLAVETGYPPFVFLDVKGQPTGLAHDYLQLVESKLGVHFRQKQFSSLNDIFLHVRSGEVHIVNAVTKTDNRSEFLSFTNPFISVPNVIVVRKERSGTLLEKDLAGLKVSLVKSYAITEHLIKSGPTFDVDLVPDDLTAILNLSFGRSDAAVIDLATASYLISLKGITNLRVAGEASLGIQLSMGVPHSEAMLSRILQKGLDAVTESERQKIHERWIHASSPSVLADRRLWAAVAGLLVAITGVMGGIILWNRTLRQQVALRTSELANTTTLLDAAFEQSLIPKMLVSMPDSVIRSCNPACREILGIADEANPIGQSFFDFKPSYQEYDRDGNLIPFDKAPLALALQGHTVINQESKIVTKEGMTHWTLASAKPIYNSQGEPIAAYLVFPDITERKKIHDEKAQLEIQLFQAQKMELVGRLAGGIAHDFNNLLTVILGNVHLALNELEPGQSLNEYITQIQKAAGKSADLTQQLLAFARKQSIVPKVLDLNDIIASILKMLQRLIGEAICLTWQPATNLWPVKTDPSQMDQILTNLCLNARDSIAGIGTIVIQTENSIVTKADCAELADAIPGEYVKLSVCDNGCGMNQETVAHIFEPFFTTKGIGQGTGLGLAMVYGAVRQNNGFITVNSKLGAGTTFTIYLPRYIGTDQVSEKDQLQPAPRGEETILLVEDEPAILNITRMLLIKQGYTVLAANSPIEAIQLASEKANEIHLLMTDVVMPEMNGRDLAQKLQSLYPQLKCLYMSGYTADVIAHHEVLDTGLYFIQKPYNMNTLADKLREVLDSQ